MKYIKALPHIVTCSDLFVNFDYTKLTGRGNIKRTYKCADKKSLAKRIFMHYLYLMFEDLVQGGHTFMLPHRKYAEIKMQRMGAVDFGRMRRKGYLQDVDIIATNQQCYAPVICFRRGPKLVTKPIRLSHEFRNVITEKMNTGYKYC